ncbi:NUDIX domain-containing protein [Streptomyces sp. NBC_01511]|uniref:NUDIX domain-containing protein n=1 Tax=Streptomyces sp. NBC_01511 TaxID=2903889 RepID=UPI003870570A
MTHPPPTWPVSVKGVALDLRGRVLPLKNERDEWELPGGRLEATDPNPESTVERELHEEPGWTVKAGPLLDTWIYQPLPPRTGRTRMPSKTLSTKRGAVPGVPGPRRSAG